MQGIEAEHLYTVHSNLYSVDEGRGRGDGEKNGEGGDMFPPDAVYSVRNSRSLSLPCLSPNAVVFLDPRVKVASFIVLLFPSPPCLCFLPLPVQQQAAGRRRRKEEEAVNKARR